MPARERSTTEGAIAKYLATEAGNAAADAAIQALGGYGYTHEYLVEKIKRDVRITTIYEGTSEIMEMTVARDRWQQHLKTHGDHYDAAARELEALSRAAPRHGRGRRGARAPRPGRAARGLPRSRGSPVTSTCCCASGGSSRSSRARRRWSAAPPARRTASSARRPRIASTRRSLAAMSRANARDVALTVATEGRALDGGRGGGTVSRRSSSPRLGVPAIQAAQAGLMADLDAVADAVYDRS